MDLCYILLALIAGACAPTQAGINSQLRIWTKDPVIAAMISFAVGTAALLIYVLASRVSWPAWRTTADLPWWIWSGGCLGAFLVAVTIIAAPKLGAASLMALMIAGQMVAGLILDHFGLVGYDLKPITLLRLVGTILVIGGVVLIKRY
jgi:bacterial/archaeal transporter family-2 protein